MDKNCNQKYQLLANQQITISLMMPSEYRNQFQSV